MSEETKKTKTRGVRRNTSARAASSPAPSGPVQASTCGHDGCSTSPACRVRYVGQTTHLRDHYAMHAARGVTHIWSAAIVSGLAVVLTGAIGYSAVQAKDTGSAGSTTAVVSAVTIQSLQAKVDALQRALDAAQRNCPVGASATSSAMGSSTSMGVNGSAGGYATSSPTTTGMGAPTTSGSYVDSSSTPATTTYYVK